MTSNEFRTDLVRSANRRGGKDVIHRPDCYRIANVDPFYIRPLRRQADYSHRIFTTCGSCLKGLSTFRLPTEKSVAELEWDRMTPEAREIATANAMSRKS